MAHFRLCPDLNDEIHFEIAPLLVQIVADHQQEHAPRKKKRKKKKKKKKKKKRKKNKNAQDVTLPAVTRKSLRLQAQDNED